MKITRSPLTVIVIFAQTLSSAQSYCSLRNTENAHATMTISIAAAPAVFVVDLLSDKHFAVVVDCCYLSVSLNLLFLLMLRLHQLTGLQTYCYKIFSILSAQCPLQLCNVITPRHNFREIHNHTKLFYESTDDTTKN